MANIEISVCSTPSGAVKIWARNNDNGRVCYGDLSGSSRGLKIEDSTATTHSKWKEDYVRALTIVDEASGILDDFPLKEIVGGASRALKESADAIEWDSVEAKIARHAAQNGVNQEYLARLLNPRGLGYQWDLTISNLDFLSKDNDDGAVPDCAPSPHVFSAVGTVETIWNF